MLQAISQAKEGQPMFIFPEGTRSKDGELLPFKPGAFKIAEKAKVDIYPIAFRGFRRHKWYHLIRKQCYVEVLDKIEVEEFEGMNSRQISDLVKQRIQEVI